MTLKFNFKINFDFKLNIINIELSIIIELKFRRLNIYMS